MKRIMLILLLLAAVSIQASASTFVAPPAPEDAEQLMPEEQDFGKGLWHILNQSLLQLQPELASATKLCAGLLGLSVLMSLLQPFQGTSKSMVELAGVVCVGYLLLGNTNSMIALGTRAVRQISDYGKLLLPVMTAALASQGGSVSAAAFYAATSLFDTLLCSLIAGILTPMIYVYLVISLVNAALEDQLLKKLKNLMKWTMTWSLKIILYVFTGYISITGVISGTVDQTAVKAAKLTISGMVPVVGGILSDASETILVSAGVVKNAAGVYGLLAIAAVTLTPFFSIGLHYLLLKITAALSSVFAGKGMTFVMEDFSVAMGMVLGMTAAVCLMQVVSVVCFLKGMG